MYGQESFIDSLPKNNIYICDDGNFELGKGNYSFKNSSDLGDLSCSISTAVIPPYSIPFGVNNFGDHITLVDNDISVSGGFDPSLFSKGVNVQRVFQGNYAIKLNDTINNASISYCSRSVMSRYFKYSGESSVTYNYSIISQRVDGLSERHIPRFIARVYNGPGSIIAEQCIAVDAQDPIFYSTGVDFGDLLFTDWRCGELSLNTEQNVEIGDVLKIEFIMTDDSKVFIYSTAYIDNICDESQACISCKECLYLYYPVAIGPDNKEAEVCIHAYNDINTGVEANYHAGEEVVLEPGFDGLYGSDGYFYIDGCSNSEEARYKTSTEQKDSMNIPDMDIQIYPNPTNGMLNILADNGVAINAVNLTSLDGKRIEISQQNDNGNYKLDMSSILRGIYILTIEKKNGEVVTQKIVKQ